MSSYQVDLEIAGRNERNKQRLKGLGLDSKRGMPLLLPLLSILLRHYQELP